MLQTDAEWDGSHIVPLLLTCFNRTKLPLFEEGHRYIPIKILYISPKKELKLYVT